MSRTSAALWARATRCIPGGVNSPVRAFTAVESSPVYIDCAAGGCLRDVDGNEYVDFVCSWGPMILGHAHPRVVEAVRRAAALGTSFGATCEIEVRMAELITAAVPGIESVRMVSSGTEGAMSAIRLARACTGRDRIVMFQGCYHGHGDSFLSQAGSGAMTLGIPASPGVTRATAADTLSAPYNDTDRLDALLTAHGDTVAAVVVEPVAGNMGVVLPEDGFLQRCRNLCDRTGALLIFDEVITGFRIGPGSAQARFHVTPDLTILGKIIGGGLPVGAFGGRRDLMEHLAPLGPVYQAGTLSGNPLALAAGHETLRIIQEQGDFYDTLRVKADSFFQAWADGFSRAGIPCTANWIDSMGCFFFTDGPVHDAESARRSDTALFAAFFRNMLARGVYLAPSQFEAMFLSAAHTDADLNRALEAQRSALQHLQHVRKGAIP